MFAVDAGPHSKHVKVIGRDLKLGSVEESIHH
jgi:hypothetical protein